MKVKASELARAVMSELEIYSESSLERMAGSYKQIAADAVKRLRKTSPKRTGGYAKSWTKKVTVSPKGVLARVYNRKFYNLTHLLENGHAKASGGRVEGETHIAPVQEWASEEALDAAAAAFEEGGGP